MPTFATHHVQFGVFAGVFAIVTVVGFLAARWRRPQNIHTLEEWGLGGRAFGNWVTWFLLSGDIYTAYTFVAIPTLMYGIGAGGFFAIPFLVILYPLLFVLLPRFWSVAHVNGYVTPAEFVRNRYGSPGLGLLVAAPGILAPMPDIALQMVGIQALFLSPHPRTGTLAARNRNTIKRNLVALPVYTLMLGFLALLGYAAISAGVQPIGGDRNTIVPRLLDSAFPAWSSGLALAAIGVGAMVPAAIMSIGSANLFTRDIYRVV